MEDLVFAFNDEIEYIIYEVIISICELRGADE
jgi:hypothetical protein